MPTGTPLQVYQQLSQQAETLDQQLLNAQDQQKTAQNTLNAANADLTKAQQALQAAENTEEGLRGQVDQLTDAQYEGARFGQLSALLTGSSAKDYLDKASMLQDMAEDSSTTLNGMQAATDAATAAQQRATKDQQTAQDATNKANDLVNQIEAAKTALQPLIQKAQQAELAVNPTLLKNHVDPSQFIIPGGAAGTAIRAAEGFIGTKYVYGGTTPSGFDCSGLMQYVWREAGVNLPRTAAEQQQVGTLVSGESNLEPGDLVFFGSPAYHVGMYLGNGYMIDAPRTGEDVQIQSIFSGFSYGRRIG
ncbi:MAG TPA: NlpC/P60 family protein [Pseudonocardiaceae bacterium]|jgi:cell wall-associated NlpC family hydrolase